MGFYETDLNFDQHVGAADLLLMLGLLGNRLLKVLSQNPVLGLLGAPVCGGVRRTVRCLRHQFSVSSRAPPPSPAIEHQYQMRSVTVTVETRCDTNDRGAGPS